MFFLHHIGYSCIELECKKCSNSSPYLHESKAVKFSVSFEIPEIIQC